MMGLWSESQANIIGVSPSRDIYSLLAIAQRKLDAFFQFATKPDRRCRGDDEASKCFCKQYMGR
jgi:hypothetical protein